jgi:hypothetical protein
MGQQSWVMDRGMAGEIDHPGQQQIIEIGINVCQSRGADGGADQGEIDIGGGTLPPQGPGAVEDRGPTSGWLASTWRMAVRAASGRPVAWAEGSGGVTVITAPGLRP